MNDLELFIDGEDLEGDISSDEQELETEISLPDAEGSGTSDYNELYNKPSINGTQLKGDVSLEALGVDLDAILEESKNHSDDNLVEAKKYADDIKPNKTSELTNDSNFAVTNQNNNFSASQTVNGTLTINGNIVQNGESYVTHAEEVHTKNDEIITREGAVGGLGEGQYAGIQAKLYDGTNNGRLGFNSSGEARVGDIGDEQPLLTRDESSNLQPGQVLVWDGENLRAVGSSEYVKFTEIDHTVKSVVGGHVTLTQAEYDALETIDENTYYYITEE